MRLKLARGERKPDIEGQNCGRDMDVIDRIPVDGLLFLDCVKLQHDGKVRP